MSSTLTDMQELRSTIKQNAKAIKDRAKAAERELTETEKGLLAESDITVRMLDAKIADSKGAIETRAIGSGHETRTEPHAILRSKDRYSDWLRANWTREHVSEGRAWPAQWDKESTGRYFKGVMTGNWHGAEAEQRAALAEGSAGTGGYLVPAPVSATLIDLLRDQLVFTQGMANTLPWAFPGNTLSVPVAVTDVYVGNFAEGTTMNPPVSDMTFNRYLMTARPYASLEVWSWELEEDSAVGVADMVANSMAQRMARAIQSDFFYGSGANVIQGVYGAAGLLKSAEGGTANAVAPSSSAGYDYWDKAIQAVRTAKADVDMVVTSPVGYQTYGRLKNTQNDAIRPSPTVQAYLNGTGGPNGDGKCYVTTAIRDTSTAGTAANDCSDLFFLWSPFIYTAIKHQFSILPLRERFSTERQAGAIAWCRLDAFVAHTEAQALLQAKTS